MHSRRARILPKAMSAELRRLPWRLFGLAMLALALACWLALISWSYADPSLNYATDGQPKNWLGARGAALADALFQGFGLAAPLLLLPVAALGLQIMQGISPVWIRSRVVFWMLAAIAVPVFFSFFPAPAKWPLSHGLGGMTGDFIVSTLVRLTPSAFVILVKPMALVVSAPIGLWLLVKACGVRWSQLSLIFETSSKPHQTGEFTMPAPRATIGERIAHRFTSWGGRMSPRSRALTATRKTPREFWMTPSSSNPPQPPVTSPQPSQQRMAVSETAAQKSTPASSPFANWGKPSTAKAAADELSSFHANSQSGRLDEDIFDDLRIEPFFGPRPMDRAFPGDDRGSPEPDTFAPLKRLTSKAADGQSGARRAMRNLSDMAASGISSFAGRAPADYREDTRNGYAESVDLNANLPSINLLAATSRTVLRPGKDDPHLAHRAATLMDVLADFGVKGRISGIYPGPVITLFELEPARGTKSSRVVGLADDIARSMSAVSARVAVVPGRDAIGIELPNASREIVSLRGIIEAPAFQASQAALPLALGKSIGGEPIVVDLARMPHLLIAGTTGSGKSVGINTMILSLLYRLPPSQCNFIMIDPKMLELSVYDGIPHLLSPVVTDPKKAIAALKWTVREMNERYELMCKLGVRNITSYNSKVAAAQLRGQPLRRMVQTGFDPRTDEPMEEEETFEPTSMPYIVVVIDEMADLMMVAGKEIEYAVQRLSQMARAAGIHLIMATQRPSVDVVTGTIKANFPSRISFQVTSKIDSRTIIGEQGAEQLLGAGDMLYMAAGGRIIRAHGPFVSDDEVESVARYLKSTGFPAYRDDILEDTGGLDDEDAPRSKDSQNADLYEQAVDLVLKDRKPTTSYIQRRLGIGYNRAASLIERMEQDGIIGAPNRTGRREILAETH